MTHWDAILVLGHAVHADGSLSAIGRERVARAVLLFRAGAAPRIILCGRWTFFITGALPVTEAEAMRREALRLGVPSSALLLEDESVDTVSNIVRAKVRYLESFGWRSVLVVTSDYHAQRVQLVCAKVLGPSYRVRIESVQHSFGFFRRQQMQRIERRLLALTRAVLGTLRPGDTAAYERLLRAEPVFFRNTIVRWIARRLVERTYGVAPRASTTARKSVERVRS